MITKVKLRHLKMFEDQEFDLSDHIILAGPNNSGKTTLLQAIAVWQLALQKWTSERGLEPRAKTRTGVPVTRKDFTAIPLREMKLLWTNANFSFKQGEASEEKPGSPKPMEITLEGKTSDQNWKLTFEFRYQGSEQIYVKPSEEDLQSLPTAAKDFRAVHVPPFSGIGAEETHYDRPYQDLLVGQGKAGDILRNLLLEIFQQEDKTSWNELCSSVEEIFRYRLLPPNYKEKPYILCEYLRGIPKGKGKNGLAQLDVAGAGSGFHQVLLLFGFLYARQASVLLLDEPDAHLHVILQKQIYDKLRQITAERNCQLIIATHSEVLVEGTDPSMILSFYKSPHRLISDTQREEVREALRRISAMDVMLAEQSSGILYVENETDFNLLRAWARVLDHPLKGWFEAQPFWHANQGRNPREAKGHFFALRAIKPGIGAILLLDGDNRGLTDHEVAADGLAIARWERYEVESYLIHPEALMRYIQSKVPPLFSEQGRKYLQDQLPPAVYRDPLQHHDYLASTPVSKSLLPGLFKAVGMDISKPEYYLIAEQMRPNEIDPEVAQKLDRIWQAFEP